MKDILKFLKPYKKMVILAPLFMLFEAGAELIQPKLMTRLIDQGVGTGDVGFISKIAIAMILVVVVGIIGGMGCLYFASIVSQRAGTDMRKAIFAKIQEFSFHNIDTFKTPSLITRLTNDITQVQLVIMMSLRLLIRAPLLAVGSVVMAFSINAKLALIFVCAVVLLAVTVGIIIKFAMPQFKIMQEKLDNVNMVMRECLAGIRVVKAFVRGDYEIEKFQKVNNDYKDTSIHAFKIMVLVMPSMMLILNGSIIAILWFGYFQSYQGTIRPEEIMALVTYLMQMLMAMMMIGMALMMVSRAKVSTDRIFEVLDAEVDIVDAPEPKVPAKFQGEVAFKNVSFKYENGTGDNVLEDISFHINPGETIGILGETGSGKSTLVNLLPRLYDVNNGAILVDGVDVRDYQLSTLRKHVAVVLQETILFTGTIRDNIKWGKPDATEEEVIAAAKAAQAHEFITSFPEGYNTELGQKGVNVSGGQKQRISIARALIQNPSIIIFDDSTSAVDSVTEKNIRESLKEFHGSATKLIIAQRISSVREADKVLVLSGGKIVAEGNHNYLMETSKDYQEINASQLKREVMLDE